MSKDPNLRSYHRADLTWTAVPRDSQDIAPVRRYQTPPRDPHDWLRASSSVVWVYTPALQPLSHGYMSKDPHLRSYGATRRVFHSKINSCDWSNTSVRCGGQLSRFEFWRFDTATHSFARLRTASSTSYGFLQLVSALGLWGCYVTQLCVEVHFRRGRVSVLVCRQ